MNALPWNNGRLKDFGLHGFDSLVENRLESGLHSGKLLLALQQKAQGLGVKILHGVEVQESLLQGNINEVSTKGGDRFFAKKMLYCTNAFTNELIKEKVVTPGRGQILVTDAIPGLKLKGTFHFDEGFYYFRNVGNRVLLGGARNKAIEAECTTQFGTTAEIQNELERFLHTHILPSTPYNILHRWSGIMGFTKNKLPLIHHVNEHTLAVIGCNGMGVALLPMIAEDVAAYF